MALGTFAVGTSGYIVAGVLPAVSSELRVSPSTAGQLITAFAIAYAIGSPLLAAATGRWERRTLLIAALLVTGLGNAFAAFAPNYPTLLVARVVTAIGAAIYTPAATAVAAQLSDPHRRARAISIVFGGLTFALIIGVPLGSLFGPIIGYRGVFGLVAVMSVAAAVAVWLAVPRIAAPPVVGLRARFAAVGDRRVVAVLAISLMGCLAAFTVYTFISPLLSQSAGVHGNTLSLLLFGYGVGGAIGNLAGGRLTDRFGSRRPLIVVFALLTLVLATMPLTTGTVPGAAIALFLWGLFTWSVNPPIQNRLVALSPQNSGLLLSLNASAIYLGVGLSGMVGAGVIGGFGLTSLAPVAAVLSGGALIVAIASGRQRAGAQESASVLEPVG
ncbi:MFS transporter [Solihabitans fulvus]|uniref:MFS transporter n=1 Tax=Solihabitans fulvus TaxID=1892852 RepID=A0A5B2XPZ1_9PSEU|nr:MFS transporter [Solihabitans fulvus]